MLWVIWDIFIPLITAFLVGLLTGWMLWRWRRRRVDAIALDALRKNASRLKTEVDNLRIRNAELSDRLQVASAGSQRSANPDTQVLERAKKRIDVLSAELKTSRQQIDKLHKQNAKANGVNRVRELEAKLNVAQRRIADLERSMTTTADDKDLQEAILVRDQMIATLRSSLEQFGDSEDNTVLKANLSLRDRKIEALERQLSEVNKQQD